MKVVFTKKEKNYRSQTLETFFDGGDSGEKKPTSSEKDSEDSEKDSEKESGEAPVILQAKFLP